MSRTFRDLRRFRLGIGLPLELEKDRESAARQSHFQAVTPAGAFWAALEQARTIETDTLREFGSGRVVRVRSAADFAILFDAEAEVVSFLGHSPTPATVELGSESVPWLELVNSCPASFAGIVDLRSCHTSFAGDCFRRALLAAKVRDYEGKLGASATYWAYSRTLSFVLSRKMGFDVAAPRVWNELKRMASSGANHG